MKKSNILKITLGGVNYVVEEISPKRSKTSAKLLLDDYAFIKDFRDENGNRIFHDDSEEQSFAA